MARVVMIGISGLDADLLRVYGPLLPNLRRLMLASPFLELRSTFPPEPAPAWASIYTGFNPANHGILSRMDYLEAVACVPQVPAGETFWDKASQAGKRVCIVNPLLAYPAWPVNGLMLSLPFGGLVTDIPSITPVDAVPAQSFPALLDAPAIPSSHQLHAFCQMLQERTEQQAATGLKLFKREAWDLFFLQLDALDHIQHFLWRYSDPGDPTYPGRNAYSGRILDFYRLFDRILGRFRAVLPEESMLLVVSGHGHARRCVYHLNMNEWLREQGLLSPRVRMMRLFDRRYLAERAKNGSIELLAQLHLHNMMPSIARHLPRRKALRYSTHIIDEGNTSAQVAELAGVSPYGGIRLNRERIEQDGRAYEWVRGDLLHKLTRLRLKGRQVVHWAKAREEYYQGKYLERYPDLLFELRNDFGVGRNLYVPLITTDPVHRIISGMHSMHGVLLLEHRSEELEVPDSVQEPSVMDVTPTVLCMLGVPGFERDGRSLVRPRLTQLI